MSVVEITVSEGVATVTLNRPAQLNAVTLELASALYRLLAEIRTREDVRVVVVEGAGGNFCSGGDVAEMVRLAAEGEDALRELFETFALATAMMREIPVPVVVAVEGSAAAGGFELMQAADIVLVSAEARISDSHVKFGLVPGGGSTQRLARNIGRQQALGVLLSGDSHSGEEAVRLGLAYACWPFEDFARERDQFVRRLAARDSETVAAIKWLVDEGLGLPLSEGIALESATAASHVARGAGRKAIQGFAHWNSDPRRAS